MYKIACNQPDDFLNITKCFWVLGWENAFLYGFWVGPFLLPVLTWRNIPLTF